MNSLLLRADGGTHVKIVGTALAAASLVVWIGIAAHLFPAPQPNAAANAAQAATTAGMAIQRF
jgi:hypothetical protein